MQPTIYTFLIVCPLVFLAGFVQKVDMLALHLTITHQIKGCGQTGKSGSDDVCGFFVDTLRFLRMCE